MNQQAVIALFVLAFIGLTQGQQCPERSTYLPWRAVGLVGNGPHSSYLPVFTENGTYDRANQDTARSLPVGGASDFYTACCPSWLISNMLCSGRVTRWNVFLTEQIQWVGGVAFECTDGTTQQTPVFGFNGTDNSLCPQKFASNSSVYQPDTEGVYPFAAGEYIQSFVGVGNAWSLPASIADSAKFKIDTKAYSCPAGQRAVGLGSRSSCYGLTDLRVICAATNNTGGSLNASSQCSSLTAAPANSSNQPALGNPNAWSYTPPQRIPQYAASAAGPVQSDCCNTGEGIANWTVAAGYIPTVSSYNFTVGFVQAQCTDGLVLAPLHYGYNNSNITAQTLNQKQLVSQWQYNTPADQKFYYSNSAAASSGSGELVTFMFPSSNTSVDSRPYIQCPPGQAAVGYSAQSGAYSLANVKLLCGTLSASANATLSRTASGRSNPPYDGEAGMCPVGVSMVPDESYSANGYLPVGTFAAWLDESNQSRPLYSANAGPFLSSCCAKGYGIKSFNIWPSNNNLNLVGGISAVCTDGTETGKVMLGFNSSNLDGSPSFCSNSTQSPKNVSLDQGQWSYRTEEGDDIFLALMETPNRTASDFRGLGTRQSQSCPSEQYPVGWGARSACYGVTDFRVICGNKAGIALPDGQSAASTKSGLGGGAIAGIAIGAAVGVALLLVVPFLLFKRHRDHKKRTLIKSDDLFIIGTTGYHNGIMTTTFDTRASMDTQNSKLMSTELMSIQDFRENDHAPVSFAGIPAEWEIKPNELKLHCVDGKPIELGRGGNGVVLFVHMEDAAIKMFKGTFKGSDAHETELLQEIAILERAKTKYVTRFLGYSVCREGIILCMEFCEGGTLWNALRTGDEYQWYNRGRLAFTHVCKGLYMLHANQICHLDMKTPNVLISNDGTCKISDLGLSKMMKGDVATMTADSMGTLAWMAPEQITGRCGLSSDIWALSTILWEICTVRKPSREAWPGEVKVPEEAPQWVVDLMTECRKDSPKERPTIAEICQKLTDMEGAEPMSRYSSMASRQSSVYSKNTARSLPSSQNFK